MADLRAHGRGALTTSLLQRRADDFASTLRRLLNDTVAPGVNVVASATDEGDRVYVAPSREGQASDDAGFGWVPLSTPAGQPERATADLYLKVGYTVSLDDERQHLQVERSVFGLCVNRASGFCPIRVEYDRYKTTKQPAHVHVSGESGGLGFAFATAGRPLRALDKLHLPVGGRRFRPTLEDFIEFLVQEGLVRNVRPGWRAAIEASRATWVTRQVGAAVRRRPEAAVEQLSAMGYRVLAPAEAGRFEAGD